MASYGGLSSERSRGAHWQNWSPIAIPSCLALAHQPIEGLLQTTIWYSQSLLYVSPNNIQDECIQVITMMVFIFFNPYYQDI